ncbi:ADP-ribosylation factor-like protein 2-binding protein isoform X2 [Cephus cinctus]|uniref:ADP-ribosylation factor-like protein 2-binding protein n=1 Tax=Cephus cinctus TaxID=211228 RepID=A0AAJ7BR81_CEPCN|nr:ADP-ribosylation factor-like protein 2-binding protein isoform X2 [Cephus cinctus]
MYRRSQNASRHIVDAFVAMSAEENLMQGISGGSGDDATFDEVIGYIEDLLMEEEFQMTQKNFLEKYWYLFEPVEENKLIYKDIFDEYNQIIESFIESNLKKAIPHFSMDSLLHQLNEKRSELDGEVFEILATFTDFLAFKEMFLDYRALKEGRVQDLSSGISITSVKSINLNDENQVE